MRQRVAECAQDARPADERAPVITDKLAGAVVGRSALHVPAAAEAMTRAVRNIGRPGIAATAMSAVDIALWDLEARLLSCPLPRLPGQVHDSVPVYGSGGFTSYNGGQDPDGGTLTPDPDQQASA